SLLCQRGHRNEHGLHVAKPEAVLGSAVLIRFELSSPNFRVQYIGQESRLNHSLVGSNQGYVLIHKRRNREVLFDNRHVAGQCTGDTDQDITPSISRTFAFSARWWTDVLNVGEVERHRAAEVSALKKHQAVVAVVVCPSTRTRGNERDHAPHLQRPPMLRNVAEPGDTGRLEWDGRV